MQLPHEIWVLVTCNEIHYLKQPVQLPLESVHYHVSNGYDNQDFPKRLPVPLRAKSTSWQPPACCNPRSLAFSGSLCEWNHTTLSLLCLTLLAQLNILKASHTAESTGISFLLLPRSSILQYDYLTICLFICQLMDIWAALNFLL